MKTGGRSAPAIDPMHALPEAVVARLILPRLDKQSLATLAQVNRQWAEAARDDYLWQPLCKELWEGKCYNPFCKKVQAGDLSWKDAYKASVLDSMRTQITEDELCSNSGWNFRFKISAGEYWVAMDPSYYGEAPMQRYFHVDSTICAGPGDPLFNNNYETRWRFTKTRFGKRGHFVKVNHWPSLLISRLPDWRFKMENQWVEYHQSP